MQTNIDEDNLHLMLKGAKRWLLFPPNKDLKWYPLLPLLRNRSDEKHRLPDGLGADPASTSIDPRNYDPIVVTLHAGEALFLPSAWAHQVEGVDIEHQAEVSDVADGAEHEQHFGHETKETEFMFSVNRFYPTWLYQTHSVKAFWQVARLRLYHWWTR